MMIWVYKDKVSFSRVAARLFTEHDFFFHDFTYPEGIPGADHANNRTIALLRALGG